MKTTKNVRKRFCTYRPTLDWLEDRTAPSAAPVGLGLDMLPVGQDATPSLLWREASSSQSTSQTVNDVDVFGNLIGQTVTTESVADDGWGNSTTATNVTTLTGNGFGGLVETGSTGSSHTTNIDDSSSSTSQTVTIFGSPGMPMGATGNSSTTADDGWGSGQHGRQCPAGWHGGRRVGR